MPRKDRPPAIDVATFEVEGYTVLVGQNARSNDGLTFGLAEPLDVWMHVAGVPGSHVIVRNPQGNEVPRAVIKRAAELAAFYSKARAAKGKVEVHVCRACDVRKPRGAKPGSVQLRHWESVRVYPPDTV